MTNSLKGGNLSQRFLHRKKVDRLNSVCAVRIRGAWSEDVFVPFTWVELGNLVFHSCDSRNRSSRVRCGDWRSLHQVYRPPERLRLSSSSSEMSAANDSVCLHVPSFTLRSCSAAVTLKSPPINQGIPVVGFACFSSVVP